MTSNEWTLTSASLLPNDTKLFTFVKCIENCMINVTLIISTVDCDLRENESKYFLIVMQLLIKKGHKVQ